MLYKYQDSQPRWVNFENHTGVKGAGGIENQGAKGHAWEPFAVGEEKVLCDLDGSGVVRCFWLTLGDLSAHALQNLILRMYWDFSITPQVEAPIGDFFGMGLGKMARFENEFFSTAEGRCFSCTIPMPFRTHCKIILVNRTGRRIKNLFYDLHLTLETVSEEDMLFHAQFREASPNKLEEDVCILPRTIGQGRYLGANIAVIPDEAQYGDLWWGEGEVKIYLDGDTQYPTLVGTGAEDYVGSAWGLGEFINRFQGCVTMEKQAASMYRFHVKDPIFFQNDIAVTIQAMGGGPAERVQQLIERGSRLSLVSRDDGDFHPIYKQAQTEPLTGYVNFFREDHYRIVAYFYLK